MFQCLPRQIWNHNSCSYPTNYCPSAKSVQEHQQLQLSHEILSLGKKCIRASNLELYEIAVRFVTAAWYRYHTSGAQQSGGLCFSWMRKQRSNV